MASARPVSSARPVFKNIVGRPSICLAVTTDTAPTPRYSVFITTLCVSHLRDPVFVHVTVLLSTLWSSGDTVMGTDHHELGGAKYCPKTTTKRVAVATTKSRHMECIMGPTQQMRRAGLCAPQRAWDDDKRATNWLTAVVVPVAITTAGTSLVLC
ncbi:hypothetical protein Pelo_18779 [Pelomyxa schiedti]|nr:hypothetical protein Pelo_18779 [Pelomyxa schiedti]